MKTKKDDSKVKWHSIAVTSIFSPLSSQFLVSGNFINSISIFIDGIPSGVNAPTTFYSILGTATSRCWCTVGDTLIAFREEKMYYKNINRNSLEGEWNETKVELTKITANVKKSIGATENFIFGLMFFCKQFQSYWNCCDDINGLPRNLYESFFFEVDLNIRSRFNHVVWNQMRKTLFPVLKK